MGSSPIAAAWGTMNDMLESIISVFSYILEVGCFWGVWKVLDVIYKHATSFINKKKEVVFTGPVIAEETICERNRAKVNR